MTVWFIPKWPYSVDGTLYKMRNLVTMSLTAKWLYKMRNLVTMSLTAKWLYKMRNLITVSLAANQFARSQTLRS